MSAYEWLEEGAASAESFGAYDGEVTLAKAGGSFYIEVYDNDGTKQVATVESKEWVRMAHWIIKEFA